MKHKSVINIQSSKKIILLSHVDYESKNYFPADIAK